MNKCLPSNKRTTLRQRLKEKWKKISDLAYEGFAEMQKDYTYKDKTDPIHCEKCGSHLGFLKMLVKFRLHKDEEFIMRCRRCKHENIRRRERIV